MPSELPFKRGLMIVAILASVIVIADQISKYAVMDWLGHDETAQITLTPFLKVVWVWNRGMSFGMFNSADAPEWQAMIFIALAVVISGFLIWWLKDQTTKGTAIAIGAVIGGAFGNVIDRILLPGVFDFVHLHVGDYAWPAFNLADACICLGALTLFFLSIRPAPQAGRQDKDPASPAPDGQS
ncbi:MAG: signal peptidase II [Alphaproteobacteria bacterium]